MLCTYIYTHTHTHRRIYIHTYVSIHPSIHTYIFKCIYTGLVHTQSKSEDVTGSSFGEHSVVGCGLDLSSHRVQYFIDGKPLVCMCLAGMCVCVYVCMWVYTYKDLSTLRVKYFIDGKPLVCVCIICI